MYIYRASLFIAHEYLKHIPHQFPLSTALSKALNLKKHNVAVP